MVSFCQHLLHSLSTLPLAAGEPLTGTDLIIRLLSRAIHIVSAIVLGGGLFYMWSVLADSGSDACFAGRRKVWARWVMIASLFLIITGLYNYMMIIGDSKKPDHEALPRAYHMILGIKMLLGLGVMFIASLISGRSAGAEKARANIMLWLKSGWLLVLVIVVIGAYLRTLH